MSIERNRRTQWPLSDDPIDLKPMLTSSIERAIRTLCFETYHFAHLSSYLQKTNPADEGEWCIELRDEILLGKKMMTETLGAYPCHCTTLLDREVEEKAINSHF